MKNLKIKLLVEVNIGEVESKYPNFQFNYTDKKDFLQNNIVAGLKHITDEQEYDAGYETVVANTMLDVMDSFVSVGDKVMYIKDNKPIFGTIRDIVFENDTEYCHIVPSLSKQDFSTDGIAVAVETKDVVTIYDFLKEV